MFIVYYPFASHKLQIFSFSYDVNSDDETVGWK